MCVSLLRHAHCTRASACASCAVGECSAHQDGTFLYTRPQSVVGLWWALEDCTKTNGCLWAVPGSHKLGVHRRFKRKADGSVGTEFEPPEPDTWDLSGAVPLEIPAGDMVLIHSAVVHFSAANTSDKSRHAYSIHVVEGGKGVEYPADNWLQRPAGVPFPAVY
ncbi:phytanoyl-CoA dioxygenase family protein [archaeon]|nr:MAG: phytanoyl-CoA dioxygenase family protein [archaeon]